MKRRNKDGSSAITRNTTGRIFAAGIAALAALLFVFAMAMRPAAYAKETSEEKITGGATAGQIAGGHASGATVLVYMNGSDLESEAGEASADITEMLKSGIGANANVVIETVGTRKWQDHGIASDHSQRFLVNQGKLELVDDSLGQLDTTDPKTLSDFISWGVANYPADRYMLLMWDHGAGPVYGFGYDEFQSDYAALTLDEMKQALAENSNVHFDFIGMDCCIMGSLETCLVLQPYCDYTILSEDFEPGIGWSYKNWMGMLEKNPGINTAELGKAIVDDMIADVSADPENGDATLALIDESAIDELYAAWTNFAYANANQLLENNYSQEVEWRDRPDSSQWGSTRPHGHQGMPANSSSCPDCEYGSDSGDSHGYGYGYGSELGYSNGNGSDLGNGYGSGNSNSNGSGLGNGYGYSDSHGNGNGSYGYGYGSYDYSDSNPYGYGFDDGSWYGDQGRFWEDWDYDMSYVTMTDYFVTDIMNVASTVDGNQSAALEAAFKNAVAHYGSTSGEEGMSGLSVTLPYGDAEFYDELVKVFTACSIDSSYVEWLQAFVNVEGAYSSNAASDWSSYGDEFANGPSYGNDSQHGYGSGYGHGYGSEYSHGYGHGYDDEYGYDNGNGYGYDSGSNGYGYSYGYESGSEESDGYGYNDNGSSSGNGYDYGSGNHGYGYESGSQGYGYGNRNGFDNGFSNGYGSSLSHVDANADRAALC